MGEKIIISAYSPDDISGAVRVWNEVVRTGSAFPQENELNEIDGNKFFMEQTFTGIARCGSAGDIVGLYILHPNNIGRCGHICNASFAVTAAARGQGIGEMLVKHCMLRAKAAGFMVLQFNAVVASNRTALNLYKKLGFTQLGVIPGGFRNSSGVYEDIIPHCITL